MSQENQGVACCTRARQSDSNERAALVFAALGIVLGGLGPFAVDGLIDRRRFQPLAALEIRRASRRNGCA